MEARPDKRLLRRFAVGSPKLIAETPRASVWQVSQSDGSPAALKVYHRDYDEEAPGLDLLQAWQGRAAAHLLGTADKAVLLEWLEGPSLSELWLDGERERADSLLVETALRLHDCNVSPTEQMPALSDWFQSLFEIESDSSWPESTKRDLGFCRGLARDLILSSESPIALHGDLHHDNIRLGQRGYAAIDPKGLIGERGYELANAFRNPEGAERQLLDADFQNARADAWSEAFNVEKRRLLQWATAHAALSLSWSLEEAEASDQTRELLSFLCSLASTSA